METTIPSLSVETFAFLQEQDGAVLLFDPATFAIVQLGRGTAQFYGLSEEQLLWGKVTDLISPSDLAAWVERLPQGPHPARGLSRQRRGDGQEFHGDCSFTLVRWRSKETVLMQVRNATNRVRILAALAESERAARSARIEGEETSLNPGILQQIAGGVGHHINNLLTIIDLHAGLLRARNGLGKAEGDSLGAISEAVGRATDITRQLLCYAAQARGAAQPCDLNQVLRRLIEDWKGSLPGRISFQGDLASEPLNVVADPALLRGGLEAILTNARDFTEGEGIIQVRSRRWGNDDGKALVEVTDSGKGIPSEHVGKVFEPFFTTKRLGEGTGLGLSGAQGIFRQHGGNILLESQPGKGTTVRIFLPLAKVADQT